MHPQIYRKAINGCLAGGHPDVQLETVFIVRGLERGGPASGFRDWQRCVFRLRTRPTEILSGVGFLILTLAGQSRSQAVHTYT